MASVHPAGLVLTVLLAAGLASPAGRAAEASDWSVTGNFAEETEKDLSGAACSGTALPLETCIIVNDEKNVVQLFAAKEGVITPGAVLKLTDGEEIDAEAAAFDPATGFFYVVGSHGRSRKQDKENLASYAIFRFKLDSSGIAGLKKSGDALRNTMLAWKAQAKEGEFAWFFDRKLSENGANIEGAAVWKGRLWLGFRGPVLPVDEGHHAFVMSLDPDALFDGGDIDARVTELLVPEDMGVRDLAAVGDGLVILTGPVTGDAGDATVWHWDGTSNTPERLLTIAAGDMPKGGKPETVLVIGATGSSARLLVLFDSEKNGKPREYSVAW